VQKSWCASSSNVARLDRSEGDPSRTTALDPALTSRTRVTTPSFDQVPRDRCVNISQFGARRLSSVRSENVWPPTLPRRKTELRPARSHRGISKGRQGSQKGEDRMSTRATKFVAAALVVSAGLIVALQPANAAEPAKAKQDQVRVATFDSGFGGFFTAKEIEKQARDLSTQGYGPFDVAHYGDTTNIPYGEKTPDQIAKFATAGILAAFQDGYKDVYIACNTASTQFEKIKENLRAVNPAYANHVYSIIEISVKETMKTVSAKLKTQDVVSIAVMATPAAIRSENYPKFYAKALNVEFKPGEFKKVTQERWLKAAGKSPTIDSYTYMTELSLGPKKKVIIYQMSPANWVEMIENGAPDNEKAAAVKNDLALLTSQIKPDASFDVVGEFCTHYPVFDAMIQKELKGLGKVAPDAPFIVQGPLFANLFRQHFVERKPAKSSQAVAAPSTPPIYLSGTNIDATKALVKKIWPNDPAPVIQTREFVSMK
jgi:glutamate racemase